jgi:hypothetical protein
VVSGRAVVIYLHNDILKFKICASTFDNKQCYKLTVKLYMKRDQNLFDQKQSPEQAMFLYYKMTDSQIIGLNINID